MMGGQSTEIKPHTTFHRKLQDSEYRRKFIHSLVLFLSFVVLGVRKAQHAPAFLDLAQITGTNVEQASLFYTAMSVGGMVGTFCMGFLFDRLTGHRLFLLSVTCILGAVTTTAIPWSTSYPLTIFLFFIDYFFSGAFETGGNTSMVRTWGVDGKMFIQFLHFSFAAGTVISPFTVQPFLSHLTSGNSSLCRPSNPLSSGSHQQEDIMLNATSVEHALSVGWNTTVGKDKCTLSESRIQYAYLIAGAMCLVSGIIIAVEGCVYHNRAKINTKLNEDHCNSRILPRWLKIVVLALIAAMFFAYFASGLIIVGYIMAFCVDGLGWSKDKGTKLTSLFWAGFCVSRLMGVVIIKYLCPVKLMFLSTSTVTLAICGLWLSVAQESEWGVWVCILVTAIGLSIVFPTAFTYIDNNVMKITGKVTSVILVAGNLQGIANPPLLGYLMQEVSFKWYIYLGLIETSLCLLSFVLLVLVVKTFVSKCYAQKVTIIIDKEEAEGTFIPNEEAVDNDSESKI